MGCFLCTQSHPKDYIVIGKADDVAAAKLAVHSSGRVQGYRFGRIALPVLAYGLTRHCFSFVRTLGGTGGGRVDRNVKVLPRISNRRIKKDWGDE
jgi:hypothetical protein